MDQLYTPCRLLGGSWEFAQLVNTCIEAWKNAFDHVPLGALWEALYYSGVGGPSFGASLYKRGRSLVRIANIKSNLF